MISVIVKYDIFFTPLFPKYSLIISCYNEKKLKKQGLSFGIVNTMLMAILERKKEIGMLMSIGMNRYKIFLMICFETTFLSMIALPFGLISSYLIVEYYSVVGIDLSIVEAGLENFGVGTRLYLKVPQEQYVVVSIMVFMISIISSIFPSLRALKINPVEATKTI